MKKRCIIWIEKIEADGITVICPPYSEDPQLIPPFAIPESLLIVETMVVCSAEIDEDEPFAVEGPFSDAPKPFELKGPFRKRQG